MSENEKALERRVRRHVTGREHDFFAVIQPGFEEVSAGELREIGVGAINAVVEGGIEFTCRLEGCYRVHLRSGTVTRVLMRLVRFRAEHFSRLRRRLEEFPWELYVRNGARVCVRVTCRRSRLRHTGKLREEFSTGIGRRLARYGMEVSAPAGAASPLPVQQVFARFEDDVCTVSLDASGEPLYRRGYKTAAAEAPIRETLACLVLKAARLRDYDTLLDPMGGSGTFSMEAAMASGRRPAGLCRPFAFQEWPSFREAAYLHLAKRLQAEEGERGGARPGRIICGDMDERALSTARLNIERAGLGNVIHLARADFLKDRYDITPGGGTLIVLNPPYGGRLESADIKGLYRRIGRRLRDEYGDCGYAVIVPGLELEKALSIHYDRKYLFMNGGIRVALLVKDGPLSTPVTEADPGMAGNE